MIKDVLKCAGATNKEADVLELSEYISQQIDYFRVDTKMRVGKVPPISCENMISSSEVVKEVQNLSKYVTNDYKTIAIYNCECNYGGKFLQIHYCIHTFTLCLK